ncbi:hypothetical protein C0992_007737 [Termitomyces sp. T32_za158]|nr:hypothetical protein C0992_007737 [Termitomyces sp. T32_za158]
MPSSEVQLLPASLPEGIPSTLAPPTLQKGIRKTPRHLIDFLPSDPRPLQQFSKEYSRLNDIRQFKRRREEPEQSGPSTSLQPPPQPDPLETEPDEIGLFRRYKIPPSRDPDQAITIHHVADAPTFVREHVNEEPSNPLAGFGPTAKEIGEQANTSTTIFFPFLNSSVFRLMSWFYSSKNLTLTTLDRLVHSVILAPDFKCEHFNGFSAIQENRRLDDTHIDTNTSGSSSSLPSWFFTDKWRSSAVCLPLPLTGQSYRSEKEVPTIEIKFFHRDFVELLKSGIQDYIAMNYHWQGFQLFWKPASDEPEQRVYGEVYTSDRFLELEETISPMEGCNLEARHYGHYMSGLVAYQNIYEVELPAFQRII